MDRIIGFADTGQVVFFSFHEVLNSSTPEISSKIFRMLRNNISSASMHTKPITEGCRPAAAVRVSNELEVGVPIRYELKSRIFMAETVEGEPIIIASNYKAHSEADMRELKALLPKSRKGDSLINLPHSLSARKASQYDLLDTMPIQNSPYAAAAEALQLGMGQINPFAVMLKAKELGIKIISLYDKELFNENHPLTTNVGHRNLGIYIEKGREYLELAIAQANPIVIAGEQFPGAVVGRFAKVMREYRENPALADAYLAAGIFEQAVNNSRTISRPR